MDAYHAYYNTNESTNPLSSGNRTQTHPLSEHQFSSPGQQQPKQPSNSTGATEKSPDNKQINVGKTNSAPGTAGENGSSPTAAAAGSGRPASGTTNIVNNIMHINHSGANINITSMPNC